MIVVQSDCAEAFGGLQAPNRRLKITTATTTHPICIYKKKGAFGRQTTEGHGDRKSIFGVQQTTPVSTSVSMKSLLEANKQQRAPLFSR